jgi:hypothetical protein
MKIVPLVLLTSILVGCDPTATMHLRAAYQSDEQDKQILELREIVISELRSQKFMSEKQITAGAAGQTCVLLTRSQRESSYPNTAFTTYAKVCTSPSELRVRFSDYPRFTISPETNEIRERITQELKRRSLPAKVVVE